MLSLWLLSAKFMDMCASDGGRFYIKQQIRRIKFFVSLRKT